MRSYITFLEIARSEKMMERRTTNFQSSRKSDWRGEAVFHDEVTKISPGSGGRGVFLRNFWLVFLQTNPVLLTWPRGIIISRTRRINNGNFPNGCPAVVWHNFDRYVNVPEHNCTEYRVIFSLKNLRFYIVLFYIKRFPLPDQYGFLKLIYEHTSGACRPFKDGGAGKL